MADRILNPQQKTWLGLNLALSLAIISSNAFLLATLISQKRLYNATNLFVMSLSLSDLLVGAVILPILIIGENFRDNFAPTSSCHIYALFITFNCITAVVSVYSILGIASERFRVIVQPLKPRFTRFQCLAAIVTLWVCATFVASIFMITLERKNDPTLILKYYNSIKGSKDTPPTTVDVNLKDDGSQVRAGATNSNNRDANQQLPPLLPQHHLSIKPFSVANNTSYPVNAMYLRSPDHGLRLYGVGGGDPVDRTIDMKHLYVRSYQTTLSVTALKKVKKRSDINVNDQKIDGFDGGRSDYRSEYEYKTYDKNAKGPMNSTQYDHNSLHERRGIVTFENFIADDTLQGLSNPTPPVFEFCSFSKWENAAYLIFQLSLGCTLPLLTAMCLYLGMVRTLWASRNNLPDEPINCGTEGNQSLRSREGSYIRSSFKASFKYSKGGGMNSKRLTEGENRQTRNGSALEDPKDRNIQCARRSNDRNRIMVEKNKQLNDNDRRGQYRPECNHYDTSVRSAKVNIDYAKYEYEATPFINSDGRGDDGGGGSLVSDRIQKLYGLRKCGNRNSSEFSVETLQKSGGRTNGGKRSSILSALGYYEPVKNDSNNTKNSSIKSAGAMARKNRQAIRLLICIMIMYTFCFLPFYVLSLVELFYPLNMPQIIYNIHNVITLTDHWANVLLYTYFSKSFRQGFSRMVSPCHKINHGCCSQAYQASENVPLSKDVIGSQISCSRNSYKAKIPTLHAGKNVQKGKRAKAQSPVCENCITKGTLATSHFGKGVSLHYRKPIPSPSLSGGRGSMPNDISPNTKSHKRRLRSHDNDTASNKETFHSLPPTMKGGKGRSKFKERFRPLSSVSQRNTKVHKSTPLTNIPSIVEDPEPADLIPINLKHINTIGRGLLGAKDPFYMGSVESLNSKRRLTVPFASTSRVIAEDSISQVFGIDIYIPFTKKDSQLPKHQRSVSPPRT